MGAASERRGLCKDRVGPVAPVTAETVASPSPATRWVVRRPRPVR
jgi:hypothetical protein